MGIRFEQSKRVFRLETKNTTYAIGVTEDGYVGHMYYGKKIEGDISGDLLRVEEAPFIPAKNNREKCSFLDTFPMEYSAGGTGDYRESCIEVRDTDGYTGCELKYKDYTIYQGKNKLEGLPASFGTEQEITSLDLVLFDEVLQLEVILTYSVFEENDVITRSVKVVNIGSRELYLDKVYSACIDMDNDNFDLISLCGSWARERHIECNKIRHGIQNLSSIKGESSHQEHPFIALSTMGLNQDCGNVYGFSFVYSGNFSATAQLSQFDSVRVTIGICEKNFGWKLNAGASFQAPEVVMTFSAEGLGTMSRNYHRFFMDHLIRSKYKHTTRPVLINNWEATYFDFDEEKLLAIAREAKKNGIEMLVMDDGWFGKRNSDDCSLGDWTVDKNKLPNGLKSLVDQVNEIGLEFGIWFEPEMISPDSDLYQAHPDWAIQLPGRVATRSRNQYVLDLSRDEVVDYVYQCVADVLHSANIKYVKWDMNRQLSDLGGSKLPSDQKKELCHRYVLGVYRLQERLITEFPDLLLENCSGGGARFDPGMLYYSPQIWCSDDTDAIERLSIQEGTALVYPLSAMGAHVSDCPNHTVGRTTPFQTRGHVALAGTFGYELDITKISEEDRNQIAGQVAEYKKYNELIREGDYYRVASWSENHQYDCYMIVSRDKSEALVTFVQVLARANYHSRMLKLKGLDDKTVYTIEGEGISGDYSGSELMNAGFKILPFGGDYQSRLYHLTAKK